jgi:hypothetical protein
MRTIIAHAHIFKNAGSTLDWSLQRCFGDDFLDHREDVLMIERGGIHVRELLEEKPDLVAMSSHHMTVRMPEIEGVEIVPVYILRHPIERIASVYEFERRQEADTPGAQAAKKYDFKDYVEWRMQMGVSRTIRNHQALYVTGKFHAGNNHPLSFLILRDAVNRLRELPLVGVVEQYDEFMVVMEEYFRDSLPELDLSYVRQNTSEIERPSGLSERVSAVLDQLGDLKQQVIDENAMDLALYQMGLRRMEQAIEEISDFDQKLAEFRARCATVQEPRQ